MSLFLAILKDPEITVTTGGCRRSRHRDCERSPSAHIRIRGRRRHCKRSPSPREHLRREARDRLGFQAPEFSSRELLMSPEAQAQERSLLPAPGFQQRASPRSRQAAPEYQQPPEQLPQQLPEPQQRAAQPDPQKPPQDRRRWSPLLRPFGTSRKNQRKGQKKRQQPPPVIPEQSSRSGPRGLSQDPRANLRQPTLVPDQQQSPDRQQAEGQQRDSIPETQPVSSKQQGQVPNGKPVSATQNPPQNQQDQSQGRQDFQQSGPALTHQNFAQNQREQSQGPWYTPQSTPILIPQVPKEEGLRSNQHSRQSTPVPRPSVSPSRSKKSSHSQQYPQQSTPVPTPQVSPAGRNEGPCKQQAKPVRNSQRWSPSKDTQSRWASASRNLPSSSRSHQHKPGNASASEAHPEKMDTPYWNGVDSESHQPTSQQPQPTPATPLGGSVWEPANLTEVKSAAPAGRHDRETKRREWREDQARRDQLEREGRGRLEQDQLEEARALSREEIQDHEEYLEQKFGRNKHAFTMEYLNGRKKGRGQAREENHRGGGGSGGDYRVNVVLNVDIHGPEGSSISPQVSVRQGRSGYPAGPSGSARASRESGVLDGHGPPMEDPSESEDGRPEASNGRRGSKGKSAMPRGHGRDDTPLKVYMASPQQR